MRRLNTFPRDDMLTELLWSIRVRSTVFCRSELSAPWGFGVVARASASFHLVLAGDGWLEVQDGEGPVVLASGDLVILPRGHAHRVRSDLSARVTLLDDLLALHSADNGRYLRYGGGGPRTELLCGSFTIEDQEAHPVLAALPSVLHIRGQDTRSAEWLPAILQLFQAELASWTPGAEALVTRLTDVLLTQAIRSQHPGLESFRSPPHGILSDPQIASALRLINEHPEHTWMAEELAAQVALSRSAFGARFRRVTGESPMRYLTHYRLARAAERLRTSNENLLLIAQRLGYASEASLSKAFKRHFGIAPGVYRRAIRSRSDGEVRARV
jgi:AraC family transcriptional regulator, alkane utilization regulator